MAFASLYREVEPTRDEIERSSGLLLLEFGADWCGHCRARDAVLQQVLADRTDVQHMRIADGRGKPLGRSFRVKLWPTLVLLENGQVIGELVRPADDEVRQLLDR
ncbi:thioredoxin family protein [Anatilimnocola floriformis]|uniref:thioredoxin family protein n=1 Tax=Anatilimnocola floriformis TaxID=2948575 RepID=UPI0020C2A9B6|nr:thioredoxin family protein [Anatilimnocola floriformis]